MKVAFVVARYGTEVNGGAELHCRMIAERLKNEWDIEILTTCALDYIHWSNHFPPGSCEVNGVKTRRFEVDHERPINTFNTFYSMLVNLHLLIKNVDVPLSGTEFLDRLFDNNHRFGNDTKFSDIILNEMESLIEPLETLWMKLQGPYSSQMLNYISTHKDAYDVFIFFCINYCSTFFGLELVSDRSILVPTMHREACISFDIYRKSLKSPRHLLFNTAEEKKFANQQFPHTKDIPNDIVGVGVDIELEPASSTQRNFNIVDPYILYLGRIDESKGCLELCHYFVNFNSKIGGKLKLVFAGKKVCELPDRPDVVHVGFVSDHEKIALIENALLVCIPSLFESLSMVLLEAWSLQTPTLVNGNCDVLRGHNHRGGGGFYYYNEEDFHKFLSLLLENPALRASLGQDGKKYVSDHYTWPTILEKYRRCANKLAKDLNSSH